MNTSDIPPGGLPQRYSRLFPISGALDLESLSLLWKVKGTVFLCSSELSTFILKLAVFKNLEDILRLKLQVNIYTACNPKRLVIKTSVLMCVSVSTYSSAYLQIYAKYLLGDTKWGFLKLLCGE